MARKLGPDAGEGVDLKFAFKAPARSADYTSGQVTAASGPYGTKDYRMALEATPLNATHTFIHITYAYAYGTTAKLGTSACRARTRSASLRAGCAASSSATPCATCWRWMPTAPRSPGLSTSASTSA